MSATATRIDYVVSGPAPVTALVQAVIDNIVTLAWQPATAGTFPVDYYQLYRGADFATAIPLSKKYVTGDILSEPQSGTYKYWVVPVDLLGLRGPEVGVYAKIDQPPDYVLHDQRDLDFTAGTCVNAAPELGQLIMPISTTQTDEQAFSSQGWANDDAAIAAGSPYVAQVVPTTASYEEVIDYGATIAAVKVTLTVTRTVVAGTVAITPTLYSSTNGTDWTSLGNVYEAIAQNFRHLKVRLAAATADNGFITVQQATVKLDVKERTHVAVVNVTDIAGTGTEVTFASLGLAPVDVKGITAQAPWTNTSADPVDARVNFVDTPNPTSFRVLAWNKNVTRCAVNGVVCHIRYIA